jgi:sulfite reductase beta subunit-like hemoprotein
MAHISRKGSAGESWGGAIMSEEEVRDYIERFKKRTEEMREDLDSAKDFFVRAGILKTDGSLSEHYA